MADRIDSTISWHPNVGKLLEIGITIRAICTECERYEDIDLAKIIAARGPDYTLFNRRCRCRLTAGCTGWNRFYHNRGSVFSPFWSTAQVERWLEVDENRSAKP